MVQVIPVVTTTLGASPEIAAQVQQGLATGSYERLGGVIRRVDNKQVVAWLREVSTEANVAPLLEQLGSLVPLTNAFALLHLSITLVDFVVVMQRLDSLARQLTGIQRELETVHRKLDLSFAARLQSGLDTARKAFGMQDRANRRSQINEAIPILMEAERQYLGLLEMELEKGGGDVTAYLSNLVLLYATTARCYLELDESATAHQHLAEGCRALKESIQRYYQLAIGGCPALYLHPDLKISLQRFTQLLRYQEPGLTEAQVFERFRDSIWQVAQQTPKDWLPKLPPTFSNQKASRAGKVGEAIKDSLGKSMSLAQLMPLLADAFKQVEQAQTALAYLEGFEIELAYLATHQIPLQAWQQLPAPEADPDASLWWILPQTSELVPVSSVE